MWERRTSQQRETQLDEAHTRIMGDHVQLDQLIAVVKQNAEALSRLSATQEQFDPAVGRGEDVTEHVAAWPPEGRRS